jgi:hypothetical protein
MTADLFPYFRYGLMQNFERYIGHCRCWCRERRMLSVIDSKVISLRDQAAFAKEARTC